MKRFLSLAAFALALTAGANAAQACRVRLPPPANSPRAELYRELDTALVIATVVNGGMTLDARLRVDETVYGRVEASPLMLGWPDDPQFSYTYESSWTQDDGSVVVGSCGRYAPHLPVVERGQRVLARLGVTQTGAQVVVRWQALDEARRDPRISAFLAARAPAERRRLGQALRPAR
jgi:hypothetical protein